MKLAKQVINLIAIIGCCDTMKEVRDAMRNKGKDIEDLAYLELKLNKVEGLIPEHGDTHVEGEMVDAAICYLVDPDHRDYAAFPWPWEEKWWKPTPQNRIKELQKAKALISAEISRLNKKNLED